MLESIEALEQFLQSSTIKLTHDEEMEDCDEYAGQLQRLRGEQQARVDLHPVDDGEVAAGQQLEAEEEGGERVGDHQRQHEGYVRRLILKSLRTTDY